MIKAKGLPHFIRRFWGEVVPDLHRRANTQALTLTSNGGLLSVLVCKVALLSPIDGSVLKSEVQALWDTGASRSCIHKDLASEIGLIPTGFCQTCTANGPRQANEYCVTLALPNGVVIRDLAVTDGDIGNGIHMLIGMDVITLGDFTITNVEKTVFSFRTPSIEKVDYVLQVKAAHAAVGNTNPRKGKKRR